MKFFCSKLTNVHVALNLTMCALIRWEWPATKVDFLITLYRTIFVGNPTIVGDTSLVATSLVSTTLSSLKVTLTKASFFAWWYLPDARIGSWREKPDPSDPVRFNTVWTQPLLNRSPRPGWYHQANGPQGSWLYPQNLFSAPFLELFCCWRSKCWLRRQTWLVRTTNGWTHLLLPVEHSGKKVPQHL